MKPYIILSPVMFLIIVLQLVIFFVAIAIKEDYSMGAIPILTICFALLMGLATAHDREAKSKMDG